jgi:hypothetical protein
LPKKLARSPWIKIQVPDSYERDAKQQAPTRGPFLKTTIVLWALRLCSVFFVLPYVTTFENKALAAAAARTHLRVSELLAISVLQSAVLLAVQQLYPAGGLALSAIHPEPP